MLAGASPAGAGEGGRRGDWSLGCSGEGNRAGTNRWAGREAPEQRDEDRKEEDAADRHEPDALGGPRGWETLGSCVISAATVRWGWTRHRWLYGGVARDGSSWVLCIPSFLEQALHPGFPGPSQGSLVFEFGNVADSCGILCLGNRTQQVTWGPSSSPALGPQ